MPRTNAPSLVIRPEFTNELSSNNDNRAALNAAFEDYVAKQREDRTRGVLPPPSQFPFPNDPGGPLHPSPCYVNFYAIDDRYPNYLQCEYDVNPTNYDQSDELKWLTDAIEQTRRLGPKKFPPIKWIALIIRNRSEHKDANTFAQSFKVGSIFKAADVFDASHNVSALIAQANMDRHPFFFDRSKSDLFPSEQQRWVIVERHAATNSPAEKPK